MIFEKERKKNVLTQAVKKIAKGKRNRQEVDSREQE